MSTFKMEHKNPEGLFVSKAFSQAITVSGKAKTIYQNDRSEQRYKDLHRRYL